MDSSRSVRVRFAPSPTGHLHVGGARTAIFNWLFAKHHGGALILRIEDTDQVRSTRESEDMVLSDLHWLGLEWSEGPDVGGIHGPYRQSERLSIYAAVAAELVERGAAYPCFCDEATLDRKRSEAEAAGRPPHYDLTCWRLPVEERRRKAEEEKLPHVVRFHVPKEPDASFDADVTIDDLIRGAVTWRKESLGDFILVRSDGMPTYNFSVVVDDSQMEISHVIRAEEHLTNTHRQVLVYRAMGWPEPAFAHVSLILGEDRTKLSKRHGATSVSQYGETGYLSDAMVNYLTLLGWSPPQGGEIFSREEAIALFSLDRVNSAPAVFDPQKLLWMNGQYLKTTETGWLRRQLSRELEHRGWVTGGGSEADAWLDQAIDLVKSGADRLPDIVDAMTPFFEFDPARGLGEEGVSEALADPGTRGVIEALSADLEQGSPLESAENYQALTERLKVATGAKGKKLFMPVRIATTGSLHGPELARVLPLLEIGSRTAGLGKILSPRERVAAVRALLG
ncbi:MAG: glutamate--tRNA ligase [Thermoanaerobaculia bacterium]